MANQVACPTCGTPMREIVWGYGTIADVADAGDVVIGGCVVDVDTAGRVAALQCPACGTRADATGIALERPEPAPAGPHPFAVAFSNPLPTEGVVTMAQQTGSGEHDAAVTDDQGVTRDAGAAPGTGAEHSTDASGYVDDDFGGVASGGDWRDHVEPYASREDALPERSAPAPDHVEPYASREDALPERSASAPERVEPYASREDVLPEAGAASPDRVDPYASREDALPESGGAWRESIDPYDASGERVADEPSPGTHVDSHALDTSDFTDAEEEGWPAPRGEG